MTDGEVYAYIQKYCHETHIFEKEYTWVKKVIAAIRHWNPDVNSYQSAAEFISKLKGRKKGDPTLAYDRNCFRIYLNEYFPEKTALNRVMEVE